MNGTRQARENALSGSTAASRVAEPAIAQGARIVATSISDTDSAAVVHRKVVTEAQALLRT
jgi:hypothetical protein